MSQPNPSSSSSSSPRGSLFMRRSLDRLPPSSPIPIPMSADLPSVRTSSSPLNPHHPSPSRTPLMKAARLSTSPPDTEHLLSQSSSTVRNSSGFFPATTITRTASNPIFKYSEPVYDVTRSHSSSPSRRTRSPDRPVARLTGSDSPHSWWSSRDASPKPGRDNVFKKQQMAIPPEQSERWEVVRQKVATAAVSVLGVTADVTHELLLVGADVLRVSPIPGLDGAARGLLSIWDAIVLVDMNRLACLRLTERCADILLAIREEIYDAGDFVGQELFNPIVKLVDTFTRVRSLLEKQIHRPFIKRYLKRNDILGEIQDCDKELMNSLSMFSLSIQIRTLRQVQDAERQHHAETEAMLRAVMDTQHVHSDSPSEQAFKPDQVVAALKTLHYAQNEHDNTHDMAALRDLMRTALQTRNDAEMIEVLQVGRQEMPDAIKTLQRALEREMEMDNDRTCQMISEEVAVFEEENLDSISQVTRDTRDSDPSSGWSQRTQASGDSGPKARDAKDTLDREFLESGIDAMRRMSRAPDLKLPAWTITRYEVDRDEKIGVGYFSDVYKGTWRNQTVAIKVLAPITSRKVFVREVEIWKSLSHPNVLTLFGASSTSGEPPWFFVSPYLKNGSLVTYLKRLQTSERLNPLRMIHEIAEGMEYLHDRGVLHGDLKAANVLVDDDSRCVISDFGQSELKSEVWRVTGTPPAHGTVRWQAPELMVNQGKLTQAMDVYSFAILCVEILTKGNLPWPHIDDDSVRYLVLKENKRPEIPIVQQWHKPFADLMSNCWDQLPSSRPSFSTIVWELKNIGSKYRIQLETSASAPDPFPDAPSRKSPNMQPIPLSDVTVPRSPKSYTTVSEAQQTGSLDHPRLRHTTTQYVPRKGSESSVVPSTPSSEAEYNHIYDLPGYQTPPPLDEVLAEIQNARRYRILLQHEFHASLTLPLWSPSVVSIGAVGYLSRPTGGFVTLFNAFNPPDTSDGVMKSMASMYGYGKIAQGSHRQDKRSPAKRGLDVIQSWLYKKDASNISRRYSLDMRAGHKTAFLCTETTMYQYVEDLEAPKKWFSANVDTILQMYGEQHQITKEDLFLIIGTLTAPDYALFVSHNHPDSQVNFNVHGTQKANQPWGFFTVNTDASLKGGPVYREEPTDNISSANKVSNVNPSGEWDAVLLARLRFKPDVLAPTSS